MSRTLPSRGAGHYHHPETGGWGFFDVQRIGRDELRVLAMFSRSREPRVMRYVWRRKGSAV